MYNEIVIWLLSMFCSVPRLDSVTLLLNFSWVELPVIMMHWKTLSGQRNPKIKCPSRQKVE